jgi:hypothetical protein
MNKAQNTGFKTQVNNHWEIDFIFPLLSQVMVIKHFGGDPP